MMAGSEKNNPQEFSLKLICKDKWLLAGGTVFIVLIDAAIDNGALGLFWQRTVLGGLLWGIAVLDYRYGMIFNRWNLAILASGLLLGNQQVVGGIMLSACLGGGVLFALRLVSHGGLGWGDIKLILAASPWLCWEQMLLALLLAFWSGGFVGCAMLLGKKRLWHDTIPFGPFLALGIWLSFVCGYEVIMWYEGLMNG